MRESSPVTFLLGVALGFLARPFIMGCLSSKPEPVYHKPVPQTIRESQPQAFPSSIPQPPVRQEAQPVLSVPRPAVTYGDRERNELKVKNLRDKLETTITTSEQVLQDEARLAMRFHKEGKKASARVLLSRRQFTKRKIQNCQTMLATVMEMLDSMDTARENAKFVESVERGTKAINDLAAGLSVDSVTRAMQDAREAEEYTHEIEAAMQADGEQLDDEEFERDIAEMTEKFGVPEQGVVDQLDDRPDRPAEPVKEVPQAINDVLRTSDNRITTDEDLNIPQPPADIPLPPKATEPEVEAEDPVPMAT